MGSVFAGNLIQRHVNGNLSHAESHAGHAIAGGMLIFAALLSVAAARVIGLLAAVHG